MPACLPFLGTLEEQLASFTCHNHNTHPGWSVHACIDPPIFQCTIWVKTGYLAAEARIYGICMSCVCTVHTCPRSNRIRDTHSAFVAVHAYACMWLALVEVVHDSTSEWVTWWSRSQSEVARAQAAGPWPDRRSIIPRAIPHARNQWSIRVHACATVGPLHTAPAVSWWSWRGGRVAKVIAMITSSLDDDVGARPCRLARAEMTWEEVGSKAEGIQSAQGWKRGVGVARRCTCGWWARTHVPRHGSVRVCVWTVKAGPHVLALFFLDLQD
jgi:hypothetical protein